jgi:hypothetical protein
VYVSERPFKIHSGRARLRSFEEAFVRVELMAVVLVSVLGTAALAGAQGATSYRVLATNKTSTMQKELQEAGTAGYRFVAVMGGETSFGGNEVVVLMQKIPAGKRFEYRLLATSKTSTMQKELQQAADAGFEFVGQTVFESLFGGKEVGVILERDPAVTAPPKYEYRLIATKRTSTLQKELQEVGELGFQALGMTVGETAVGGGELVVITRRKTQ